MGSKGPLSGDATAAARLSGADGLLLLALVALSTSVVFSPLLPLAAVGGALFVVLASKHPRYAIYLLSFSFGVNLTILSEPVHISVPQLFALTVIAALALRKMLKGNLRISGRRLWAWSGLLVVAASFPSFVFSVAPSGAVAGTVQLTLIGLLIYASVQFFEPGRVSIHRVCQFIVLGAIVSAVHAFVQSALVLGPASFLRGGMLRVYASYGQPNTYGLYLAGVLPLTLVLLVRVRRYAVPFLMLSVALLLTGSRGAIVSAAAAVTLVLVLLQIRRRSSAMVPVLVAGLGAAAGFLLFPPGWLRSLVTISDWSAQQRLFGLLTAWKGISQRPITGFGAGSFQFLVSDLRVEGLTDDIEMPHNILLDIWFELGILALLAFLVLVLLYYRQTIRAFLRYDDLHLLALLGAFTGLLTASMFSTLIVRGIGEFFGLVVGMTAGRLSWLEAQSAHHLPDDRATQAFSGPG